MQDSARAVATLERMEQTIPRSKVPMAWELMADLMSFYYRLRRPDQYETIANELEPQMRALIDAGQENLNSYYNPYRVLLEIYELRHDDASTLDLLNRLAERFPNDPGLRQRISSVRARMQAGGGGDTLARAQ